MLATTLRRGNNTLDGNAYEGFERPHRLAIFAVLLAAAI